MLSRGEEGATNHKLSHFKRLLEKHLEKGALNKVPVPPKARRVPWRVMAFIQGSEAPVIYKEPARGFRQGQPSHSHTQRVLGFGRRELKFGRLWIITQREDRNESRPGHKGQERGARAKVWGRVRTTCRLLHMLLLLFLEGLLSLCDGSAILCPPGILRPYS